MTGLLPLAVALVPPTLAWLAARGQDLELQIAVVGLVATFSIPAGVELRRARERRREQAKEMPAPRGVLAREQLEQWRAALRDDVDELRVAADGQLDRLVRHGDVEDLPARHSDQTRLRVRVGARLVPWSEITRSWDRSPGRMVILGDPGYGKTVAALTLVAHINAQAAEPGAPIAELFALADWQRWDGEHPDKPLADWLADQLALTYAQRGLSAAVAGRLIAKRLVVPILDGLDELADIDDRRACVAAIDAYAERTQPHRPFVLTCRADEYRQLAPDWVRDDQCLQLVGLQPDQVRDRLDEHTRARPAWKAVSERDVAGNTTIEQLCQSPLYLAIVLQVYRDRDRDPSELLDLSIAQARRRLWELLLDTHAASYDDATPQQVRAWLAWIATGLQRSGRQRFMLHELHALDPDAGANARAFSRRIRVAVGLAHGLPLGLVAGLAGGLVGGLVFGLVGLIIAPPLWSSVPSVRAERSWRQRIRFATRAERLRVDAAGGLATAPVGALVSRLFELGAGRVGALGVALGTGLITGLVGVARDLLEPEEIVADAPQRLRHAGPDAVLASSRVNGLVTGLVVGLIGGLSVALVVGLIVGLIGGLAYGLGVGLIGGLSAGLPFGLGAWLYHHWLRRRLARRGALPADLPGFLRWCAQDERNWLRITEAYEFRHRELLDHLAPSP